jgi:hypothetical protein
MKSTYTLSATSSVPVLLVLLLGTLRVRVAHCVAAVLCVALVALVLCNIGLISWIGGWIG